MVVQSIGQTPPSVEEETPTRQLVTTTSRALQLRPSPPAKVVSLRLLLVLLCALVFTTIGVTVTSLVTHATTHILLTPSVKSIDVPTRVPLMTRSVSSIS